MIQYILPKITDKNTELSVEFKNNPIQNLPNFLKRNIHIPIINLYDSDWTNYAFNNNEFTGTIDKELYMSTDSINTSIRTQLPDFLLPYLKVNFIANPPENISLVGVGTYNSERVLNWLQVFVNGAIVLDGMALDNDMPYSLDEHVYDIIAHRLNVFAADLYFSGNHLSLNFAPQRIRRALIRRITSSPVGTGHIIESFTNKVVSFIRDSDSSHVTANLSDCNLLVTGYAEEFINGQWINFPITNNYTINGSSCEFTHAYLYGYYPCYNSNKDIIIAQLSDITTTDVFASPIDTINYAGYSYTDTPASTTMDVTIKLNPIGKENYPRIGFGPRSSLDLQQIQRRRFFSKSEIKYFKNSDNDYTIDINIEPWIIGKSNQKSSVFALEKNYSLSDSLVFTSGARAEAVGFNFLVGFHQNSISANSFKELFSYNIGNRDIPIKIRLDIINPFYYREESKIEKN